MADVNPDNQDERLAARLAVFGARDSVALHKTDLARIFKVTLAGGGFGVLKLYHGSDMAGEAPGLSVLRAAKGVAAVDILAADTDAVLMSFLEGPSLGDLSRAGDDDRANGLLVAGVKALHGALPKTLHGLATLDRRFESLLELQYGPGCPVELQRHMRRATELAKDLLGAPELPRILHGDVHHDNAILTADGVRFIDAKGLFGDPGFEVANSFRNPRGAGDLVCDPDRAKRLARECASHLSVDANRQLAWAAAKCALSIAWRAGSTLNGDDPDRLTLSMLLGLWDQEI